MTKKTQEKIKNGVDPTLLIDTSILNSLYSRPKAVRKLFKKIAEGSLSMEKEFKFKKEKEKKIYWIEIPIINNKIPNHTRSLVPEISKANKVEFHVKLEELNNISLWMNMFPKTSEKKGDVYYTGILHIGFSEKTIDSVEKTNKTNQWYTGPFEKNSQKPE